MESRKVHALQICISNKMNDKIYLTESVGVLNEIVSIFEELSINYFLTGSLASGVRGEFRATNDIDIVAELKSKDVVKFVDSASKTFFADIEHVTNAVAAQKSFNLIHIETIIKVDIFTRIDSLQIEQLKRSTPVEIPGIDLPVKIASAEDIIISKLVWYQKGGRVSERQWRDIQGVLAINGSAIDRSYIFQWCEQLEISDLAEKIFEMT